MNNTTRQIDWTTADGATVTVTIKIVTSETIKADGQCMVVDTCKWSETVRRDGNYMGSDIQRMSPAQVGLIVCTGHCGRQPIPADVMDQIDIYRAELRATALWTDHVAKINQHHCKCDEYDASISRIVKINSGTY
jgi:hypothetical protein